MVTTSSLRRASGTDGISKEKGEEDEMKQRARLVRNRESAHLLRQRKKEYMEELEGKVKAMQATIADLCTRISCITAENAALKQQLGGAGAAPPPPMPLYPAVYPLPMPWMHPAYAMHGSQIPLMPIPRLKPQQPAPAVAKPPAKKARKANKVASVSLLGLLCLVMLCGCLIPTVNRMNGSVDAREGARFGPSHHGRVLAVEGPRDSANWMSKSSAHIECQISKFLGEERGGEDFRRGQRGAQWGGVRWRDGRERGSGRM
ncbi:bZIP transcription factor 60-like [Setaria viridis]|uniref:bZIP transcription factor 60-like n=1 Tax=Setaria viridis TaxID=4556 RepID=UPI003B3BDD58